MSRVKLIFFFSPITLHLTTLTLLSSITLSVSPRVLPISTTPTNSNNIFDTSLYGKLQLNNGLAQTPQMGWNSWNFFACNINETLVKETADAGDVSKQKKCCTRRATSKMPSEGCKLDLSDAKAYYSRHKVCGMHSKTSKVIVAGLEQRFCQQCSRL